MAPSPPPEHVDHLRWVRASRRLVLGREPILREAIGFLTGYDAATGYALFRDLHVWLVVRLGGGWNIHWRGLLVRKALGLGPYAPVGSRDAEPNAQAVDRAIDIVIERLDEINTLDGRAQMYAAYPQPGSTP